MAVFNTSQAPSQISGSVSLNGATSFQVVNITAISADTEYSYTLPTDTKKFKLRARGMSRLQIADTSGNTNLVFFTIFPGETYEDDILTTAATIYFEASKAGEIIEFLIWT